MKALPNTSPKKQIPSNKPIPRSLWALLIALCCFQPLQAAEILTPNISEIMANHSPSRQHTAEELERFYLPEVSFHDATLEQALKNLVSQYTLVCFRSGEIPLELSFDIQGNPTEKFTLSTGGSLTDILENLAVRTSMAVENSGSKFTFTPAGDAISTGTFAVQPDFMTILSDLFKSSSPLDSKNIFNLFKEQFHLDESTTLSYSSPTSALIVKAAPSDMAQIKKFVQAVTKRKPLQFRIRSLLLSIPSSHSLDCATNKQLTDGQAQMIMRSVSSFKGASVSILPSTVYRHNEEALIEVIQELGPQNKGWSGVKLAIKSSLYGLGNETVLFYEQRPPLKSKQSANPRHKILQPARVLEALFLKDSHSMLIKIHESKEVSQYLLITSNIIDTDR